MNDRVKQQLTDAVVTKRNEGRPTLADALAVCRTAFQQVRDQPVELHLDGPETWMWEDLGQREIGLPKFYVLSLSTSEGNEGYPMLTIRQAYSLRLDTWVTTSQLLVGPDFRGVAKSIALAIANHIGSFAGFRHSVTAIVQSGGDAQAGIRAASEMMRADDEYLLGPEGITEIANELESKREVDPKDAN